MSKKKRDRTGHVSMFPAYYPSNPRDRTLAYLVPIFDDEEYIVAYHMYTEGDRKHIVTSYDELVELGFSMNLDIYTNRFIGKQAFIWFKEAIDKGAEVVVQNSTKVPSRLSVLGRGQWKRRKISIITTSAWGVTKPPDKAFIIALRNIFNYFKHGVKPSASSLGVEAIVDWHRKQKLKKFSRPSSMLRQKLYKHGSGGRSDDFDLSVDIGQKYEQDINNSYGAQASAGTPISGAESVGLVNVFMLDISSVENYGTAFCQARITIPDDNIRKFSPFYQRDNTGTLHWVTDPGVYEGWYWSNMLQRCIEAGYKVDIAFAWCWPVLDTWLAKWVEEVVAMREYFKSKGMELEEDISKRIIVSAIGCFAMRDYKLTVVSANRKQEGDEALLNLMPEAYESMLTPFYIHRVDTPDANYLTQVAYYIIMRNNIALYDRCIAEEMAGNVVLETRTDAIYTKYPPTQPISSALGEWKMKVVKVVEPKTGDVVTVKQSKHQQGKEVIKNGQRPRIEDLLRAGMGIRLRGESNPDGEGEP